MAGNRHSDKEKFRIDLNRPESCEMSEQPLKTLLKSRDFQSEHELRRLSHAAANRYRWPYGRVSRDAGD